MQSKFPWLAEQVNKQLSAGTLYRVRKSWSDATSQIGAYTNLDNAKKVCDNAGAAYYVFDANGNAVYPIGYRVKVIASALNIRSGPGVNYSKVGCITDSGVYTIIEEQNGFGRLKSKIGWVSLDYVQKI